MEKHALSVEHRFCRKTTPWFQPTKSLVSVVVSLVVVGLLLWMVNTYIPMDARIKQILNIVIIIAVVLWLLSAFGILGGLPRVQLGRL